MRVFCYLSREIRSQNGIIHAFDELIRTHGRPTELYAYGTVIGSGALIARWAAKNGVEVLPLTTNIKHLFRYPGTPHPACKHCNLMLMVYQETTYETRNITRCCERLQIPIFTVRPTMTRRMERNVKVYS